MAKQVLIKLNGIDVTSKVLEYEIEQNYQETISSMFLYLIRSVDELVNISPFQNVEVWESYSDPIEIDANKIFRGFISKINSEVYRYELSCYDELWQAVRKQVTKSYDMNIDPSAGKISEIFIDLVTTYAELNADSSSVQDSGTTYLLNKYICKGADVFERIQTLAEVLDWQFYYRADTDKVYFEPKGFNVNSNIIYIGGDNNNVQEKVKWTQDISNLANVVVVRGNIYLSSQTELFNGDGGTDNFTIRQIPESVKVLVDGIELKGGVLGAVATYDYLIDKQNRQIIFEIPPAIGTENVEIAYYWGAPTPVEVKNDLSVAQYGESAKTLIFTDIMTVNDAEQRAINYLNKFSKPLLFTTTKITPDNLESLGIKIGQYMRVIDDEQSIDDNFLINKIRGHYPSRDVELGIGDKSWEANAFDEDTAKRLKRLEEQMTIASDYLIHVRQFDHTGIPRKLQRKDIEIKTIAINNSWILNHTNNSILSGGGGAIYGTGIYGTSIYGVTGVIGSLLGDRRGAEIQIYYEDYT